MTTSESHNPLHPVELLEAYALDALDTEEASQVELHLDGCAQCGLEVAQLQLAAADLAQTVSRRSLSPERQSRLFAGLIEAVDPAVSPALALAPATSAGAGTIRPSPWAPAARFILPVAAAIMVGLFTAVVVMNVRLSGRTDSMQQDNATLTVRTDSLQRENATLTAQVALSTEEDAKIAEDLRLVRLTNYWLANPAVQSVQLSPPTGDGNSRGILLMTPDGNRAILMVAEMEDKSPTSSYEVWLMRHGDRVLAGTVTVDKWGWGTVSLVAEESLLRFEKVELITERVPGITTADGDMVLEAIIPGLKPSQMVVLLPWQ